MTTPSGTRLGRWGWPDTRLGRRTVTLAALSLTGIVLLVLSFTLDLVQPANGYTDNWAQTAWGAGIWACAVAALSTGLISITRHHDRSRLVLVATGLGLLPLVLLVSEIALGKF